eukprot:3422656-Amphidinium_carterae.2
MQVHAVEEQQQTVEEVAHLTATEELLGSTQSQWVIDEWRDLWAERGKPQGLRQPKRKQKCQRKK